MVHGVPVASLRQIDESLSKLMIKLSLLPIKNNESRWSLKLTLFGTKQDTVSVYKEDAVGREFMCQ